MAGDFYDVVVAQQQAAGERRTQEQNSARLALYRHTQESNGVGVVRLDEPVLFDVVFLERPLFTTGASCVVAADPAVWHLPVGSAGVWAWERNPKGHYIGAYIYLEVRMETVSRDVLDYPYVAMAHDLLFSGVAYKDLGSAVSTEAQILTPRSVNFGGL